MDKEKVQRDLEEVQLYSNMAVLSIVKNCKDQVKKANRLTIIAFSLMFIQTLVICFSILYFCNTFDVELTTEEILEYSVDGGSEGSVNAVINSISGDYNEIKNTIGGGE